MGELLPEDKTLSGRWLLNWSSLFAWLESLLVKGGGLTERHVFLVLLCKLCKGVFAFGHDICLVKWSLSLGAILDRHAFVLLHILRQGHLRKAILTTNKGRLIRHILLLVPVLLIVLWDHVGHRSRNRLILLTIQFLETTLRVNLWLLSLRPVKIGWLLRGALVLVNVASLRLRCEHRALPMRQGHSRSSLWHGLERLGGWYKFLYLRHSERVACCCRLRRLDRRKVFSNYWLAWHKLLGRDNIHWPLERGDLCLHLVRLLILTCGAHRLSRDKRRSHVHL